MTWYNNIKIRGAYVNSPSWHRVMWGLKFPAPLMNAAGMFKNGEGYNIVAQMGAGGYIGGTSTYNLRHGNSVDGVNLPFITLIKSHVTINFLGLPNLGDKILSNKKVLLGNKICPLGWSVMRSPDFTEEVGLAYLVESLWMYHDNPQIDFIEINESCPNIKVSANNIAARLEYIACNFISKRSRHFPVIIKISIDITPDGLYQLMQLLFEYKFDGVNIGNTSTNYTDIKNSIDPKEAKLYDYFTTKFGGGIGGRVLKNQSYNLCKLAVEYMQQKKPKHEFHVIRSGGIDSVEDIFMSDEIGVSMNQWYSGYFTNYIKYGNRVYQQFFAN